MRQMKWDNFGLLVQPLASKRPWMVTQGNHEVEKIPKIHKRSFTSYNARWLMPYQESASPSNLFYCFQVAGAHVIMIGSYEGFALDSPRYRWLKADLQKVNRKRTSWLVVVVHAPWYNSNVAHQFEYAAQGMKSVMEDVIYRARVDVVFAGHVHAYEGFARVYKDKEDKCGSVYITSGAEGNREGLARR
ncbi:probable purple acid phosphatase 20 [Phtheirospermum japonicum]|uniref:acid phosphatase n=1 Tax=Phtheirospermum japonicum TaxID=374723 RepID=A0A830C0Y6_9LAMI|nr:probable purple acid phosphatase 20 [Phtheirospermum japonicum]